MSRWLSAEKRALLVEQYSDFPAYRYIRVPVLKWSHQHQLQLHATEVFYLAFYAIDGLMEMGHSERLHYCREALWDELIEQFGLQPVDEEEKEKELLSVALVVAAVVHCLLLCCDKIPWYQAGNALLEVLTYHLTEHQSKELHTYFINSMTGRQESEVAAWMEQYLHSDSCLSNDIYDLLANMQEADPQTRPAPSTIRIAPNCKSKVLVVFDAMYNAGWLVDEKGQKLTNRDKALREILRLAFAEQNDKGNLRSSIWPNKVKDVEKRNSGYFKELEAYMSKEGEAR